VTHVGLRALHTDHGFAVGSLEDLLDFVVEVAEDVPDLIDPDLHPGVAVERTGHRHLGRVLNHHVLIEVLERDILWVVFKLGPAAANDLDLLLRHRLLLKPGGFEGFRAIQEVVLPEDQAPSEREQLKYRLTYG
jgi:hypothetical protein